MIPQTYETLGLKGDRVPVGAVLRIGRKMAQHSGAPGERDRFYIVEPIESPFEIQRRGKKVDVGQRAPHPDFAAFNSAPPEHRRVIRGNIVHHRVVDCWQVRLSAQVLGQPFPTHPNRRPGCYSEDGKTYKRYLGDSETGEEMWGEGPCPNRLCEYRQSTNLKCKPLCRLWFLPRWERDKYLPQPLMRYVTSSWNTAENITGLFNHVDEQARSFGLGQYSLFGLPFILNLSQKTDRRKGRVYPVVTMTTDGDLVAFFRRQRLALDDAGTAPQIAGALEAAENKADIIDADAAEILPPVVPRSTTERGVPKNG
ncbi:MAG: hypothetical protein OES46_19860 [Gammaproteobacteria bacterium]|nr:hypothetical protein [Gammaproteobacteria bacterium]